MASRLPPLNALRAFVAAARHVSFRLAAEELCVTPGAVSRQIRTLETHLGVALFDRSRRQVQLTPAGARYFTRMAALFAQMEEATEDARGQEPPDGVRLDVIPTFAMHWLLPRLPDFRRRRPGAEVSLTTATGPVDRNARFDYAIRRDVAHFAGLPPVPLMEEISAPIGCPGGRPGPEMPRGATDLAHHTIITIRARPDLWPAWCAAQGLELAAFPHRLEVDHTFFAIQAAEDGVGVAVVPLLFVDRPLSAGRLAEPLGPAGRVRTGQYFLLEGPGPRPAEALGFRDWLVEQAGD